LRDGGIDVRMQATRKAPALGVPAVVKLTKRGTSGRVKPPGPDPEADARVAAWFARNFRPIDS
jgi:hypothetical protein